MMERWGKGGDDDAERKEPGDDGDADSGVVRNVSDSAVEGERDMPSVNKERTLQSRTNNLLALLVVTLLGGGFLFWWFTSNHYQRLDAQAKDIQDRQAKASGELKLPPLGPVDGPRAASTDTSAPPDDGPTLIGDVLGPAPPVGNVSGMTPVSVGAAPAGAPQGPAQPTAAELAMQRKLSPSVLYKQNLQGVPIVGGMTSTSASGGAPEAPPYGVLAQGGSSVGGGAAGIGGYLSPTVTPAISAQVLASRRFVIPKGNFVDCTLETALDSQLPGLATCVTAFDIFGADGKVVLIERGSKLVGETKGEARQGMNRIFVLWTEARTPTGVVVHLASPATDELGRTGLPGNVDTQFWARFGAAIMVSVIDGVVQALVQSQSQSNGTSVVLNPQGSREVMSEILKNTINIPPKITKNQGERIQVLVARDVDFRSVYELRAPGASGQELRANRAD